MIVSKIKYLLCNKFFCYVNIVVLFVLIENCVVAQIDSLKTDTTKVAIEDANVVNDTSVRIMPLDTVVYLGADTTFLIPTKKRKIIPAKATLYSMILPGLGQAYNGKYWKIPIIYTVFGAMYYFAADNHQKYEDFKSAYKHFGTESQPEWVYEGISDASYLKTRMEYYKRNRDFNIIIGGLFYLLNILDANVDAHLMDFDVSEDLSLRIEPDLNYYQAAHKNSNVSGFGIKFVLSLNR